MSNHPRPVITADLIIYKYNRQAFADEEPTIEILLIKRGKDPFKDCFAFPGGHFDVDSDLSIEHCAHRELSEETGLSNHNLKFFKYYDEPGRDPRGRYVDFVFTAEVRTKPIAVAADDAADAQWFEFVPTFDEETNIYLLNKYGITLAFDHQKILFEFFKEFFKSGF